jgi:hypothetical protein
MATRKVFYGKAYFDRDDYTNRTIVRLGEYSFTQRGLNAAVKKMENLFPEAWLVDVDASDEIAQTYNHYSR